MGSGYVCVTVGRAVASATTVRIQSLTNFYVEIMPLNVEDTKIKKESPGNGRVPITYYLITADIA